MTDAGTELVSQVAPAVQQAAQQAAPVAQQAARQAAQQAAFVWWLVLAVAFTVLFAAELVRSLPWTEKAKASKPLNCDLCLTTWGSVAVGALFVWQLGGLMTLFHVPFAGGVTLLLFALMRYWRGALPPTE